MSAKEKLYRKLESVSPVLKTIAPEQDLYRDLSLDSLAFLRLVVELESEFGISFGIEEIADCLTVGALTSAMERKLERRK